MSLSTGHGPDSAKPAALDGKDIDDKGEVVPDVAWWQRTMAQDLLTHA